jgi:glutathione S-transferase
MAGSDGTPVLWHLKVSSYNEKARWALDYKRVAHVRRAVDPGPHRKIAHRLTGGRTFPVLELDGKAIGDSTRIIEALERDHPDPPLYPSDPAERQRALELEDYFDEELGPYVRLLVVHGLLTDASLLLGAFSPDLSRGRRFVARAIFPRLRRRIAASMDIDDVSVEHAYQKVRRAGGRFRGELQPSGYLSGAEEGARRLRDPRLHARPVRAPPRHVGGDRRSPLAHRTSTRTVLVPSPRTCSRRTRGASSSGARQVVTSSGCRRSSLMSSSTRGMTVRAWVRPT